MVLLETLSGEFVSFPTELVAKEEEAVRPLGKNPRSESRLTYLSSRDDAKMRNLCRHPVGSDAVGF